MEQEVARKLVPILLNKLIEWHCRKGIRKDCDCEYCTLKWQATRDFWMAGRRLAREAVQQAYQERTVNGIHVRTYSDRNIYYDLSGNPRFDSDSIGYSVWLGRKKLRKLWRDELARLKNQILTGEPTLEKETSINPAF